MYQVEYSKFSFPVSTLQIWKENWNGLRNDFIPKIVCKSVT